MFFSLWKKARESVPDGTLVLVHVGEGSAVNFNLDVAPLGFVYSPVYLDAAAATQRLSDLGIPWVLVNAPDEVAAACGVPVD